MMATTEREPKLWIGCLAAYNEGHLHGKWFEVPETVDELGDQVSQVIKTSPALYPEESFFADNEDFHPWSPGEYPGWKQVVLAAALIREHGGAAAGWLSNDDSALNEVDDYEELDERFRESYAGTWESEEAYAREYVGDCGLPGVGFVYPEVRWDQERPTWSDALDALDSQGILDWDTIARQVTEDVHVIEVDGETHFFRSV